MVQRTVPEDHGHESEKERKKEEAEVTDQEVETVENTEREVEKEIVITSQNHHDRHTDLIEIGIGTEKGRENTAADDIDSGYLLNDDVK